MMDSLTGDQFRLGIQDGSVTVVDALPAALYSRRPFSEEEVEKLVAGLFLMVAPSVVVESKIVFPGVHRSFRRWS